MRSSFHGIETARRALFANKKALDTTGHNIANADTKGYSRQKASMSATAPYTAPAINSPYTPGQIGTGVEVTSVERMRDDFIDAQIREETRSKGSWENKSDTLQKLETLYTEPSDTGLRTVFDQFWESLQELSDNPEDRTARTQVMERGISLADTVNHMYDQFVNLKEDLDETIQVRVDDINAIASQLANLNEQIQNIEARTNQNANDLRDRRDVLLDELSELTNYNLTEDDRGSVRVTIGGTSLVDGVNYNEIEFDPEREQVNNNEDNGPEGHYLNRQEPEGGTVRWRHTDQEITFRDGAMGGLFTSRDEITQGHIDELRSVMAQFKENFNVIHGDQRAFNRYQAEAAQNGEDPFSEDIDRVTNFFEWRNDGSQLLRINKDIQDDVNLINAGYIDADTLSQYVDQETLEGLRFDTDIASFIEENNLNPADLMFPGNGENASRLADLKDREIIMEDPEEADLYYNVDLPEGNYRVEENNGAFELLDDNDNVVATSEDGIVWHDVDDEDRMVLYTGVRLGDGDEIQLNEPTENRREDGTLIGTSTFNEYTDATVSDLGVAAQEASRMVENQELLVDQLENRRQAVSGVSLDEEMTNMLQYQQAYNAASRMVTTVDESLDTIINQMGLVGRA